jgi:hypothetical protein
MLIMCITALLCGACGLEDDGTTEDRPVAVEPEDDSGGLGVELILPFDSDTGCVLTRAYCAAEGPWPSDIGPNGENYCSHHATARYNDAYALDFACGAGTPVVATADGTIAVVRRDETGWGHHVLIDHGEGLYSLYGHLMRIDVREGQRVRQAERIGGMGSTGFSTGPHVHFSLMRGDGSSGPFQAVVPEPLSGHIGLHDGGRRVYGAVGSHGNLPVGSIIKAHDAPEIYVVCGEMRICHIADWEAFTTRRFFHDAISPLDRVVTVSSETLSCYQEGETVDGPSVRALIDCAGDDWLFISENGSSIRRRVPFDKDADRASYDALVRSWGFSREERRAGSLGECVARNGGDLRLRDGTLIELASDNDFYVVTSDRWGSEAEHRTDAGFVRRVHRHVDGTPFMPYLYRGYEQVLFVPDDAVFTMTAGMRHGENVFGPGEAAMCSYGPDRTGGDEPDHEGTEGPPSDEDTDPPDEDTDEPDPSDDPHSCVPDTDQDGDDETSEDPPPPDPSSDAPPHTIMCVRTPDALVVRIHGPILDGLHEGTVSDPLMLQYGSNHPYEWDLPYPLSSSRAMTPWEGDDVVHELSLPPDTDGFNLFVTGDDGGRWFDLDTQDGDPLAWEVGGDCRRDGTLILTTDP